MDLFKEVYYDSQDWLKIKSYLEEQKASKVRQLIGSETHDHSNELRGAIKFIDSLLRAEEAARKAATQGHI